MHLWGLFCTCSPLPVIFLSTGITLPFWNESREYNNWDFSNLSLGNDRSPFWAPQILSLRNDCDLLWQLLLQLSLTFVLSAGPLKLFPERIIEISGREDFWTGTDRKRTGTLSLCSKWRGLLQVSPSFLQNIGDDAYMQTFGTPLEINLWMQDVCVSIFLDREFPDFAEETEFVSSYLRSLLLLRKRILTRYHLYFLFVCFQVEGLIERVSCSLTSKRMFFFAVS